VPGGLKAMMTPNPWITKEIAVNDNPGRSPQLQVLYSPE